jgi:hypothetical protein
MTVLATERTLAPAARTDRWVRHRTVELDGIRVFYREAGPREAPVEDSLSNNAFQSSFVRTFVWCTVASTILCSTI